MAKIIKWIGAATAFCAFIAVISVANAADYMEFGDFLTKALTWTAVFLLGYKVADIASDYEEV